MLDLDLGSPDDESTRPTPPDLERLISPNEVTDQVTRQGIGFASTLHQTGAA